MIPIPFDTLPNGDNPDTTQSPQTVRFDIDFKQAEIDSNTVSTFTVVAGEEGSLPEIHTQGDPDVTVKVFALLMNQLVSPVLALPSSPEVPFLPSNPITPQTATETPPLRKRGFVMDSLRRSVRVRAQGNEVVPAMTKVQDRVHNIYNLRSSGKCNVLVRNHPYSRLTVKEVAELFRAYQIKIGFNELNAPKIIQAIKNLYKSDFDCMINKALDTLKGQSDNFCLILDHDASGALRSFSQHIDS